MTRGDRRKSGAPTRFGFGGDNHGSKLTIMRQKRNTESMQNAVPFSARRKNPAAVRMAAIEIQAANPSSPREAAEIISGWSYTPREPSSSSTGSRRRSKKIRARKTRDRSSTKKPHRFRPGTVALREIRKFQKV